MTRDEKYDAAAIESGTDQMGAVETTVFENPFGMSVARPREPKALGGGQSRLNGKTRPAALKVRRICGVWTIH